MLATESKPLEYTRPWLYPKQSAALFNPKRFAIIEASTKSGKTVGCMAWLFEQGAVHGRAGRNYWWVAPTLPVAKIAYRRLKRAIPRSLYKPNDSDVTLTLVNGAMLWFKGADRPDTLYGEDVYGAVVDEASRCKQEAWTAIRTTLTATQGPARIIGNVKGKQNWAYRLARKAEAGQLKDWAFFRLMADDAVAAGVFPSDEVQSAKEVMPEAAWKELYYAEATDDGSNPFDLRAIADCTTDAPLIGETLCWGWDFARAEDFTVGTGLDKQYQVTRFERWQHVPWGETKEMVRLHTGAIPAWGDSTGVGDAVVEDLQRAGVPMIAVPFSVPMKQKLMVRLRGALQQRKLRFPDGPIRAELESFTYEYTAHGVRYTAPEGMHDDCVMALALAVYGRDQFGEIPEPVLEPGRNVDVHPGYDYDAKKRKKPWEQGWQPDAPPPGWLPGKEMVPL